MKAKILGLGFIPIVVLLFTGCGLLSVSRLYSTIGPTPNLTPAQIESLTPDQLKFALNASYKSSLALNHLIVTTVDVLFWGGLLIMGAAVWLLVSFWLLSKAQQGIQLDGPASGGSAS
ncbi:MAG: hypothetical protein E6R07_14995 [Nevskiaceae bacterium]|nr:MAG: hypothetical protein E6R07_14995 [Nevskiaceae bacterium]